MYIDKNGGPAQVSGTVAQGREIKVSKGTVLQIRAAFLAEALNLRRAAQEAATAVVVPPGGDGTSAAAAKGMNQRFWEGEDSYAARTLEYAQSYEDLAENLAATARQYGYTDEQIAASFTTTGASTLDGHG